MYEFVYIYFNKIQSMHHVLCDHLKWTITNNTNNKLCGDKVYYIFCVASLAHIGVHMCEFTGVNSRIDAE